MRRSFAAIGLASVVVVTTASGALACGGLVAPNGSINLLRTATLAAYVDGVEHYITSFEFAGGGAEFGSIVPLPGIPSDVKRGGDWTLQRLQEYVAPPVRTALLAKNQSLGATADAEVILETKIDALDITVLKGGGTEVGTWAKENGFALTPDAPEILDFYADRSPIFMAARFDVGRAHDLDQAVGDGTPIHVTIPTPNPWVPLRILGLGRQPFETIEADVFLLTEASPTLLPAPGSDESAPGVVIERSEEPTPLLLNDLASDKGMGWLPRADMHLTYMKIDARAGDLDHDLAIDATGTSVPSHIAAGLTTPASPWRAPEQLPWGLWVGAAIMGAVVLAFLLRGATMES